MSKISNEIDKIIIHQLKLHWTTTRDIAEHVADGLYMKYPNSEITISGVQARLESLQEERQVEKIESYGKPVWKIAGNNTTIPNRIWNVITGLAKLECPIQSIMYTIRKQHGTITVYEINEAIGVLQSSSIIAVKDKIASVTPSEKQSLMAVISS